MVTSRFEELYETHLNGVKKYFIRQFGKNFEDAEDLAQDTFYRMFNHAKIYGDGDVNRFYLYKIAQNVKYDYIKRRIAVAAVAIEDIALADCTDVAAEAEINFTLNGLTDDEKKLFSMLKFSMRSHEIAAAFGISPSGARARINTLRKKFKGTSK